MLQEFAQAQGGMTTADLVRCERRLIDAATCRTGETSVVVPIEVFEAELAADDRQLTGEQAEVVRATTTSPHGVQVVEALAGTGKTYTAGALRAVYEGAGYRGPRRG